MGVSLVTDIEVVGKDVEVVGYMVVSLVTVERRVDVVTGVVVVLDGRVVVIVEVAVDVLIG